MYHGFNLEILPGSKVLFLAPSHSPSPTLHQTQTKPNPLRRGKGKGKSTTEGERGNGSKESNLRILTLDETTNNSAKVPVNMKLYWPVYLQVTMEVKRNAELPFQDYLHGNPYCSN